MNYSTRLLMSEFVTHDVKRFILEKPDGFSFKPGQGVELAIDDANWKDEGRPFTPTSRTDDGVIEFTIKQYPDHKGMTQALHELKPGAKLLMSDTFGTIEYKGPGVFIAGGAGVTPFIAILRDLQQKNAIDRQTLIFSNKTPADIINEKEFTHNLGDRCLLTCTQSSASGYDNSRIDKAYLQKHINNFDQHFYICGPDPFMEAITGALEELGAETDTLVFEQ